MELLLDNRTRFSDRKILEIIRFVRPPHTKLPPIRIKSVKTYCFSGKFYYTQEGRKIVCNVGCLRENYPNFIKRDTNAKRRGYLSNFWIRNQEEALVYLLAHELRHSYQDQNPNALRLGEKFTNQHFSERDTDTYALWKLANWRKKKKKAKKI